MDKNESGFSLIELMVIIAIIGILAGLSAIGMNFVRQQRVSGAARQLLGDIQKTRVDALTSGMSTTIFGYGIRLSPPSSYVSFAWNDNDNPSPDFIYQTGEESNATTYTVPSSLTLSISGASSPAYTVLIYNRFGLPTRYDGAGNSLALATQDMDLVIQDTATGNAKCVKVTTNSIREGVWSGTVCTPQ